MALPASRTTVLSGIFYMLLAMFTFCVANVFVKSVAPHYPIIEIVFFRNFFALIPAFYMVMRGGGVSALKTPNMPYHALCGAAGVLGLYCLFMGFQLLPLADATCLAYASILFVTALSGPFLKEYIEMPRWLAVLVGFMGVVIMSKPTGDIFNHDIFYILSFSMVDAFIMLSARKLSRTNAPGTIVFYYSLFGTLTSGLFLFFTWKTPTAIAFLQFAAIGLGGGIAQIFLTQAYKRAPAGAVAPMIYSTMLWSVLFGYILFDEVPSLHLWAGSVIVIASGLYIIYRENKEDTTKEIIESAALKGEDLLIEQSA